MPRRPRSLSTRALSVLRRVAAAQRASGAPVPVEAVIRQQSAAEWDSVHVLCKRLLVVPAAGRLTMTRAGWAVAHGRP